MQRGFTLATLLLIPLVAACHRPLDHSMNCEKVLQLRLGQTPEEVRALIGEPEFAGSQGTVWRDGSAATDFTFIYSKTSEVYIGTRDEMNVDFLKNRLVEVSAYRMDVHWWGHGDGTTALMLGSRDYGYRTPPFHTIGPAFNQVFHCPSSFSLNESRRRFEAE
jgi:hypothetical protein